MERSVLWEVKTTMNLKGRTPALPLGIVCVHLQAVNPETHSQNGRLVSSTGDTAANQVGPGPVSPVTRRANCNHSRPALRPERLKVEAAVEGDATCVSDT